MNHYFLSRCVRNAEYEEWNYYFSENNKVNRVNKVLIFFYPNVNNIYLLSTSMTDLDNKEYLNEVINLVHDLPTDFNLVTEYIENSDDDYIDNKVLEIRNKENKTNINE